MHELIGAAAIVRAAYERRYPAELANVLQPRLNAASDDAAALMDLATMLEVGGRRDEAMAWQAAALAIQRTYETAFGSGFGLRVLLVKVAGDLMANTPVEFLLESSNARLLSVYVDAGMGRIPALPDHDVAIIGVGEAAANHDMLRRLETWRQAWPKPVVNNDPARILNLERSRLATLFRQSRRVLAPDTIVVDCADDETAVDAAALAYPLIVRPLGAHAGAGTELIDSAASWRAWRASSAARHVTLTSYVDYASADGLFRKQRIVFIDGQPFASHQAVSRNWMVHYLNADMETHADRRAEEAAWMQTFDEDFACRHSDAFGEIVERIGLDYFGIDCGELRDGRLIVFEADTAMIVHALDPPALFPYKGPAMRKIFAAFEAALRRRACAGDRAVAPSVNTGVNICPAP